MAHVQSLEGPWRFWMFREKRLVATGAQFEDETCVLRWCDMALPRSTAVFRSFSELTEIHGHDGTVFEWLEKAPTPAFLLGKSHCVQDTFENAPFASIGGIDARSNPVPKYAKPGEEAEYVRGYEAAAEALHGPDWRTCEFGWVAAIRIGDHA